MVELADYYEQGIWVKKDSEKARQLLKKAADAGSIAAKWQLEFLESEK
jgi:TPR repeat protein